MQLVWDAFGKPDPGQCCSRRNWNYRAEGLQSWLWFAGATSPWAGENVGAVLLPLKLYLPLILAFQFPHSAQTPPSILFPSLSLCFPYKDLPGHFLSVSVGGGGLVCEHGQVRRIAAEFFFSQMSSHRNLTLRAAGWIHLSPAGTPSWLARGNLFINPTADCDMIIIKL